MPAKGTRKELILKLGIVLLVFVVIILTSVIFILVNQNKPEISHNSTNPCTPLPGFTCGNVIYLNSTGTITLVLGQNTGLNWIASNFIYVPEGTPYIDGLPATFSTSAAVSDNGNTVYGTYEGGGLLSGQTVPVTLPVNGVSTKGFAKLATPLPIGTPSQGSIWAQYEEVPDGFYLYTRIAVVNITASNELVPNPVTSNSYQPSCVANKGFLCYNPIFSHVTGTITVDLGQDTNTTWSTANFIFVAQGTPRANYGAGLPDLSFGAPNANSMVSTSKYFANLGLQPNQIIYITLPINGISTGGLYSLVLLPVGIPAMGSIWVEYTTTANQIPQYQQIATVNVTAS